jgi:phospholipase C
MKNLKGLAFISLLLFLVCAAEQPRNTSVLRGRVTLDGQPLSDAVVSLFLLGGSGYDKTIATKSDATGAYRFDGLTRGEYVMLVSSKGGTRIYQGKLLIGQKAETVKDVSSTSSGFSGNGKPDSPQASSPIASLSGFRPPIKHLIVLMMENRSFDHMLGALKAVDPRIDGLSGDESNPDTAGGRAKVKPDAEFQSQLNPDPNHHFPAVDLQIFGGDTSSGRVANMQGFVKSYFDQQADIEHSRKIMYYFAREKLPVLTTLATEFAVCDRWFSSVPAPSIPNRAFAHYGTSFGHLDMGLVYPAEPYRSIYVRMLENKHTAKLYYYDSQSSTMEVTSLLQNHPQIYGTFQQFMDDARKGALPEYSFVEPNYNDHSVEGEERVANDQHPDHNVQAGEVFIAMVYMAIRSNPALWRDSVLLITYSNHGGIYDHVPPPAATPDGFVAPPDQTGTGKAFAFDRLGVRVPAVIVSSWIPRGTVDHTVYDHASIPATVGKLFLTGPQNVSPRERSASTFDHVLTLTVPRTDAPDFEY